MTRMASSDQVGTVRRVRRALAGLALGAAGALALVAPGTGAAAMTSDRAFDRYLEVTWAQSAAEIDCDFGGDRSQCDRAERLESGAATWLARYEVLSAREVESGFSLLGYRSDSSFGAYVGGYHRP